MGRSFLVHTHFALCMVQIVMAMALTSNGIFISRNGMRCRIITRTGTERERSTNDDGPNNDDDVDPPPLVLLGGMAQSLTSHDHHLPSLSRNRDVILYECLGQGPEYDGRDDADVTLHRQSALLWETLDELLDVGEKNYEKRYLVDIAGFSFGGRVAMAAATVRYDQIRKLHLSGVALDRSDRGHMAMQSFPDIIEADPSVRSFAWSILLATYSSSYLRKLSPEILQRFIQHICDNNTQSGLLGLFKQSEVTDESDPWHVKNMVDRIDPNLRSDIRMRICVGEHDEMAPVMFAAALNEKLLGPNHQKQVDVLPSCGHAVTVESPRLWRESVLSLLGS